MNDSCRPPVKWLNNSANRKRKGVRYPPGVPVKTKKEQSDLRF
jgi:hypothetical protein